MKKLTKKYIQSVLRTMDSTQIFKLAKQYGIDIESRVDIMRFVEKFAPTQKIERDAFRLTLCTSHANQLKTIHGRLNQPIRSAVEFAKRQVNDGSTQTNYGKILIEGNTNIYWAHSGYGHSDYNKHIAFPNTERNRKAMDLINLMLNKSQQRATA
jgi:hypothetical protein